MYLKLSKLLRNLSFKIRQKSLYYELKYYIKNKMTYVKSINKHERCIGKTYSLIQLAHEFNCPIFASHCVHEDYLRETSRKHFNKDVKIIRSVDNLSGKRYKLILFDEGIGEKYLNDVIIPMADYVVGYIN